MLTIGAIVGICIIFDVVAGIAAAAKSHTLSSSVMRDGLYHKLGEILLILLAIFCHYILTIYPFTNIGIPAEVTYTVAVYIILMEILSIIENICKLNPDMPFSKILDIFNLPVDKLPEDTVESESATEE